MTWNDGRKHGYKDAVWTVALNDEPMELEEDQILDQPTVCLLAYIFNQPVAKVARDVIRARIEDDSYNAGNC